MPRYPFFGHPAVYVDPAIVTFTADPTFAELGSTVNNVVLRWTLSKNPNTLTLNGVSLAPNTKLFNAAGPFTTSQKWKLKVGDEQRAVIGSTTLTFANKGYWGLVPAAPASSADILALANTLFLPKNYVAKMEIGAPANLVFCYAYPARFGSPRNINLLASSHLWQPPTTNVSFTNYTLTVVPFTNASGYTENYNVVTFNAPLPYDSTVVQFLHTSKPPYTNNVDWDQTDDGFGGPEGWGADYLVPGPDTYYDGLE